MFWTIIRILFYIAIILLGIFWWLPDVNKYVDTSKIFGTIWGAIKNAFSGL